MSEISANDSPERSGDDQFAHLATALMDVIQRFPDYFNRPEVLRTGPDEVGAVSGESRGTVILRELMVIKSQLEAGQLKDIVKVSVFEGLQSRVVSNPRGMEHNRLISELYRALSPLSTAPAEDRADYFDLQNYAKKLQARELTSVVGAEYRFLWGEDKALTGEDKNPVGLQLKLGDNLFVEFDVNRFDEPGHEYEGMSTVDLYVVPDRANRPINRPRP